MTSQIGREEKNPFEGVFDPPGKEKETFGLEGHKKLSSSTSSNQSLKGRTDSDSDETSKAVDSVVKAFGFLSTWRETPTGESETSQKKQSVSDELLRLLYVDEYATHINTCITRMGEIKDEKEKAKVLQCLIPKLQTPEQAIACISLLSQIKELELKQKLSIKFPFELTLNEAVRQPYQELLKSTTGD